MIPVAVTPSAPGSLLLCGYTDDGGAVTLARTSLLLHIKPAHRESLRKAKQRCWRIHKRRARARCLRRVRLRAGLEPLTPLPAAPAERSGAAVPGAATFASPPIPTVNHNDYFRGK